MPLTNEDYKQYKRVRALQGFVGALNQERDRFRALRQARVKQARDEEIFNLEKKQAELKLKQMEMDPNYDPGVVALNKKKLKFQSQSQINQFKKQERQQQFAEYGFNDKLRLLSQKAESLNQMTDQYPELFGDLMIVPNMETGVIELKPKTGVQVKAQSEIAKNYAYANKAMASDPRYEIAKNMSMDEAGLKVDPELYEQNLRRFGLMPEIADPNAGRGSATATYQVGQTVNKGGKSYKYLGNDQWEEQ